MGENVAYTLRDRIRSDTSMEHKRLDDCVSNLSLRSKSGLSVYLRSHLTAYNVISKQVKNAPDYIGKRARLAIKDLEILGSNSERIDFSFILGPVEPIGLQYVIEGSHLGARILVREWALSLDDRVKAAKFFINDTSLAEPWKSTINVLKSTESNSSKSDKVVETANNCFQLFRAAFQINLKNGV